jgi:cell division protein FtsA
MPPGEEIIHVLPQEYIIDNEQGIRDPIGMSGIRMEANFHIISGQVTAARNINKCVHRANLNVTELILEPLASADAVLSQERRKPGWCWWTSVVVPRTSPSSSTTSSATPL